MSGRGYGIIDLLFAALYAYLGFVVAPSRSSVFQLALVGIVGLLALAGASLVAAPASRAARLLALLACATLLALTAVAIVLLALSAAYLFGVFGALGRGTGIAVLLVAALFVELCGILPLFQLRYHLRQRS